MLRHCLRLASLTMLLGVLYVPAAHAGPHVSIQFEVGGPIAAPVFGAPVPYAGYVWQPGYYVWTGYGYRWGSGAWVFPSYGRRGWAYGHWNRERRGWDRNDRYRYPDRRDWGRAHDGNRDRGYRGR